MNVILKGAALGAAFLAVPAVSQAAVLDFATYAKGNEHGVINGDAENIGGLNITFHAYDGNNNAFAYFDSSPVSVTNTAGLGVCSVLRGSQLNSDEYGGGTNECNPGSDDNVTSGESVMLTFDFVVDMHSLQFTNGGHKPVLGTDTLLINGGEYTFDQASAIHFVGQSISFAYGGSSANQFYLIGATGSVPAPAALGFFGLGLAGLGFARRRS